MFRSRSVDSHIQTHAFQEIRLDLLEIRSFLHHFGKLPPYPNFYSNTRTIGANCYGVFRNFASLLSGKLLSEIRNAKYEALSNV